MTWALEQLVKELKSHPFTLIIVIGLCAAVWMADNRHASASELKEVTEKIDVVTESLDVVIELQLSQTLRSLSQDLCTANGSKAVIQRLYDEKARLYRRLTGDDFTAPHCDDADEPG